MQASPRQLPAQRAAYPLGPTEQEWAALTPAQQARREQELVQALCAAIEADWQANPPEGEPHQEAWLEAKDALRTFFRKRRPGGLYVAADMPVFYPGRTSFSPDILAVLDVPTHPRTSWMVAREGKGLDFVLEFRHEGSWRKDFVDNVTDYAELGIAEYFAFDIGKRQLRGWRLPPGRRAYQPILPQAGRYRSDVLDLELGVLDGALRFFDGNAELLGGERRVGLLERLAQEAEARAEAAQAQAEQAQMQAEQAQAALAEAVFAILRVRGVPVDEESRGRIQGCYDTGQLTRWLRHASEARSAAALLDTDAQET